MLPGPNEILELGDRESVSLRIVSWEDGSMIIHPKYAGAPPEKEIPVLRLHLAPGVKAYPPQYYDVTSKTLIAQFKPMLGEPGYDRFEYRITAYGVAPRKRFTVMRIPL